MPQKYIFPDSTCFFSQANLLNCIKDPKEDFLWIHEFWWNITWNENIIHEFCLDLALKFSSNQTLSDINYEEILEKSETLKKHILREREYVTETIKKLISVGLAGYITWDNDNISDFLKLYDCTYNDFSKKKIELLNPTNKIVSKINVLPTIDVDIMALSEITGVELNTTNEHLEHYLVERKYSIKNELLTSSFEYLRTCEIENIEEYLGDKPKYIEKSKKIHHGHLETASTIVRGLIDITPIGNVVSGIETACKLQKVSEDWPKYEREHCFNILRRNIEKNKQSACIVDIFSTFRLNVPQKTRDL